MWPRGLWRRHWLCWHVQKIFHFFSPQCDSSFWIWVHLKCGTFQVLGMYIQNMHPGNAVVLFLIIWSLHWQRAAVNDCELLASMFIHLHQINDNWHCENIGLPQWWRRTAYQKCRRQLLNSVSSVGVGLKSGNGTGPWISTWAIIEVPSLSRRWLSK